jgi:hypothetical protein
MIFQEKVHIFNLNVGKKLQIRLLKIPVTFIARRCTDIQNNYLLTFRIS